jgi:hypothetical protein
MYLHFALFFFFRSHENRKQDAKSGTAAWFSIDPNAPTLGFDQCLRN